MFKNTILRSLFLSGCLAGSVAIVSGCAFFMDKSYQRVTIETPGAQNALCHVYVDKIHFPVDAPGEISIPKTKKDMEIECLAPGNRRKAVTVPPRITETNKYNASTLFAGTLFDVASGAIYEFPDVIQISFVGIPTKPYPGPEHDAPDLRDTSEYYLEEFMPSQPRLNSDRHVAPVEIKKRERAIIRDQKLMKQDSMSSVDSVGEYEAPASLSYGETLAPSPDSPPLAPTQRAQPAPAPSSSTGSDTDFSRFNVTDF